ncbi:GerAB/ArcD/ProY family transporter [Paenisporosarcina sp. TG-14]|uniref:GerAB/ArcD/ProY family transporter n=1 Tax=Paenisporosarcina sp. TG-14 TaxID=1231057 RepID=UPI0002DE2929|nr:endospore germination permease [Paenisporosarcina sp. TG-14]
MRTFQLPNTPIIATHILFLILVIFTLRLGLETFSRTAEFSFPWLLLLILILILSIAPQIDFKNLQPMYAEGVKPIIRASVSFIGTPVLELVAFLMIFPAINRLQGSKTGFLAGFLFGGGILLITSLLTVLVLGADLTGRSMYPSYELAKKINVGDFIQRVEALASFTWILSIFIKLCICFYASAVCLTQTLQIKNDRSVIIPLAIILLILSIIAYPNTAYYISFVNKSWPALALIFGLFLPLLLLVLSMIKKKNVPKS